MKPRKPRKTNCRECGKEFIASGSGPLPSYCPEHAKHTNKGRQAKTAAKVLREAKRAAAPVNDLLQTADELENAGEIQRRRDFAPLLLAAGLAIVDDVERAAAMMKIPPDVDLDIAERDAREQFGPVMKLKGEGFQMMTLLAANVALAEIIPKIAAIPVGQLGSTLKAILESAEKLQGSVSRTFGEYKIVFTQKPPKAVPRPVKEVKKSG